MTTREQCLKLQAEGIAQSEIARIVGLSRQRVNQICGKNGTGHFKPLTESECVYPKWREWMNENRCSRTELIRRMGLVYHPRYHSSLSCWMRGKNYPVKPTIDRLIRTTGLSYEQLFSREA